MPTDFVQLPDIQAEASSTLEEPAAATQSTEAEPQTIPAAPLFEVRLTAVRSGARILRSGGIELEVQQDKVADIHVDEGIQVVKPEGKAEQSYSILDFADNLEVELFGDTSLFIANLRQGAGDEAQVTLHLEAGQMFLHLNEQKNTHVTIQTPAATIRTLTTGAEFDLCHNDGLTCVFVKKGVVEVTTEDRTELVKAGEASQVLMDQRPSAAICAPISRLTDWEENYRQFANTPALGTEIAKLPQDGCPVTALGLPTNARILYQDQFTNPFSGWARGKINNFIVRYAGLRFYRVQAQQFDSQLLTYVPNTRIFADANIDVKAIAEAETTADFRYGTVFRKSGDQYYAFIISPVTKTWYFLKSSSAGLDTLKQGTAERMRDLDARETLRVETYGSTFLLFINDRLIDWVSDADYASGEVGLFVESMDNPDVQIRFDSIIIWEIPTAGSNSYEPGREYCFNTVDDDGDKLADRADPDCQRVDRTPTPRPLPTKTPLPPKTATPPPTKTSIPPTKTAILPTNTPIPPTATPRPTSTRTRRPTNTPTNPPPTTAVPPTATDQPTNTNPPPPTDPPTATNPPYP